ncbi:HNH endonuclease [Kitasatospora sp. NPDC088391]|uniref:HNH endonuclease n=1 Tax=Kitasatospora sp. NPDC088391 TaxID=3364074 RepID=UPI0037FCBA29
MRGNGPGNSAERGDDRRRTVGADLGAHAARRVLDSADLNTDLEADGPGCWLWQGMKDRDGYGRMTYKGPRHSRKWFAHRVAVHVWRDPIPPGMEVDHRCGVRTCVNPWHLDVVLPAENRRNATHHGLKDSLDVNRGQHYVWEITQLARAAEQTHTRKRRT